MALHDAVRSVGHLDEIGSGEDGEHRHGHDDRVDARVEHSEPHAERSDDEREFADLCQREAALHGYAQILPRHEHTQGAEENHACDHHRRKQQDLPPVRGDHVRVHHHSYRDEEYRSEEVLHRRDQSVDPFGQDCARQDGAHHECSELKRESADHAKHSHREAEGHRHHQNCLVVELSAQFRDKRWKHVHSHHKPDYEEKKQFAD